MVRLTIDLNDHRLLKGISLLVLFYLIYHINNLILSIDITFLDKVLYFFLIILATVLFWTPYYFVNNLDTWGDKPLRDVLIENNLHIPIIVISLVALFYAVFKVLF